MSENISSSAGEQTRTGGHRRLSLRLPPPRARPAATLPRPPLRAALRSGFPSPPPSGPALRPSPRSLCPGGPCPPRPHCACAAPPGPAPGPRPRPHQLLPSTQQPAPRVPPLPSAPLPAPHALTADAVPVDDHGGGGGRAAAARVSAQRPESGRERGGKGRVSAGPSSYSGHVPARHRARAPSSPRPPRPAWRPRAAIGQEAVGGRGGDTSEAVVAAFVRWRRILQRNRLPADARRVLLAGQ